ncbi:S8 family serine peptidase [Azospirillum sp. TSO35-2]|uniref:S8 family serine peptidase n=1 Tax=Azospirillum sp. TSO35-2 TaxID=716796 RepID=UPI000D6412EB|nr:S8 family serine peptidase [Azospirillum sp. TSO35-2]
MPAAQPISLMDSVAAVRIAIVADAAVDIPARFVFVVPANQDLAAMRSALSTAFASLGGTVEPVSVLSPRELALVFPGRRFIGPAQAFEAAHALEAALRLPVVEADLPHAVMPVHGTDPAPDETIEESVETLLPGCWVEPEDRLKDKGDWALGILNVREAWAFAEKAGRPSKGAGIIVAQPDTGIVAHPELDPAHTARGFNVMDGEEPRDPTDPMSGGGNPGHGTGTASVLVSPETGVVVGSAPAALHMPIRAIESVVRLSQAKVAQAIDRAVDQGAHVITMSLGGIYSPALRRALERAVAADVIVLAAAGNCVGFVVWPARFDDCIAIGGTNADDKPWPGSCRGPDVDVSAPAQNVYRASARTGDSGQGQGTSFAVALVAGAAACWLAYHGRANVIAAARARGETVQSLFRRLLKATARRPKEWEPLEMGAGVVDALALLKADLDTGRDTEGPLATGVAPPPGRSVRDLVLESVGTPALRAPVDWNRFGAELSLAILKTRRKGAPAAPLESGLESTGGTAVPLLSAAARRELPSGLLSTLDREPPAVHSPPESAGSQPSGRLQQLDRQRRILAARHAALQDGISESAQAMEESVGPDAPLPDPQDVLHRIDQVVKAMPPDEMGDPDAFRAALGTLMRHGESALAKLADPGVPDHAMSREDIGALEAVIIADGSRPSFLLRDGLAPASHPFLGIWADDIATFRYGLQPIAKAIGRVQPEGGHASRFIGTACLVDAGKGLMLTNYHVVDDARRKFGVPMTVQGNRLTVHGGLEIDFEGESGKLNRNRFNVVEVILPEGYGRGFGSLDAAVLRIEPVNATSAMPTMAIPLSANPNFITGGSPTLCTIGYPGPPPKSTGTSGTVDWSFVTATLFGNLFGYKRLAPGRFTQQLGDDPRDTLGIAISHDATTFGGASGSFVIAWKDGASPAFALHFSGETEKKNNAISLAAAAEALRAIGVPIP